MDEYGHATVLNAPPNFPLTDFVNQRTLEVGELFDSTIRARVGITLHFDAGSIHIVNCADELVVTATPPTYLTAEL